jgi:SAM-dependent methyltransferase
VNLASTPGPGPSPVPVGGSGFEVPVSVPGFDPRRPHPARVYACWLGYRKDTFAADRAAADQVTRVAPWVVAGARGSRAFLTRAVTHLAKSGITQYLDVGSGLPTAGNVHQIAQRVNPDSKVVYVDLDPLVLAHARALLASARTIAVAGDARDPQTILGNPEVKAHLDLDRPVAVLFSAILHFIGEQQDPAGIVATFRNALAPGSHIVISHVADLPDHDGPARSTATRQAVQLYQDLAAPFVLRTQAQVTALFDGLDLLPPGVVQVHLWRPGRRRPGPPIPVLAGIGRVIGPGTTPDSHPGGLTRGRGPGGGDAPGPQARTDEPGGDQR